MLSTGSPRARQQPAPALDRRLLPILCSVGTIVSINTHNIGQAKIQGLERDLHMHGQDFNVAMMAFFIPCILFGVPANMLMRRSRPPWFLGFMAFVCGIVAIGEGLTQSYAGLCVCHLILGFSTTGFQAGVLYLLAAYIPRYALHKRLTLFLSCRLVGSALGGLIAGGLTNMDGVKGYSSWRWLFIVEGMVTSIVAICAIPIIPGWPEQQGLTSKGPTPLVSSAGGPGSELAEPSDSLPAFKEVARSVLPYLSGLIHFSCTAIASSSAAVLPAILRGLGWPKSKAHYMSIPVFCTAAALGMMNAWGSDLFRHRFAFCAAPLLLVTVACSILLAGNHVEAGVAYMACFYLVSGNFAAESTAITWLSNNVQGRHKRGLALGLQASIGNLGFLVGSNVFLENEAPQYPSGYGVCLGLSTLAVVVTIGQLGYLISKTRRLQKSACQTRCMY